MTKYISGCAWIVGPNEICGQPYHIADPIHIALCPKHRPALRTWQRSIIADLYQQLPEAPHTPGYTYVVKVPDGAYKIGYTGKDDVRPRLMSLHRQLGQLEVVGILKGGWSLEAVLHHQWIDCRLEGYGERFEPNDTMSKWLDTLSIDPEQQASVDRYYDYVPKASAPVPVAA